MPTCSFSHLSAPLLLLGSVSCLPDEPDLPDEPEVFACDETLGDACMERSDGTTWSVAATAAFVDQSENRATIVLVSAEICPYESSTADPLAIDDRFDAVCAGVAYWGELDGMDADGAWGGVRSVHAIATGFAFPVAGGTRVGEAERRTAQAWHCDYVLEHESGDTNVGELTTLTDGTVTVTESKPDHAVVEFDFPDARGRLIARYCPD